MKELDDKIFYIGNEFSIPSLLEQTRCMLYNVEAFIALSSGLEILDRISSIAYWAKLIFYDGMLLLKPLGLPNFHHVVEQGFIPKVARRVIIFVSTVVS